MRDPVRTVGMGTFALVLLAALGATGCKGHVEKNAEGEVTSVGVKTDPKATEAAKEAGHDVAEAGREAGQEIKQGAEKAGDAIAEGADKAGDAVAEGAEKARESVDKGAAKMAAATDDAGITTKVKAKLLADPEVGGLKISVETKNGKVTLTGSAESAYQKTEAGKLARHTEGVVDVDNRIEVKPTK